MKRIAVAGLIAADGASVYTVRRMHTVHLGNGRRVSFNSRREALAYQADVNRMLNAILHELNHLLGCAHVEFRAAWPLLAHDGAPVRAAEANLRSRIQQADVLLDRAITHTTGPNGMHFAWKFLGLSAGEVAAVFTALADFHRARYRYEMAQRCAMFGRAAAHAERQLASYGLPI